MTRRPLVIAHDYLTQRGGAEKVVLALTRGFPGVPIQTTLYEPDDTYSDFREVEVRSTGLNGSQWLRRHHRYALPFLAASVSRTTIDADVTLVSSSAWAHGFRTTGRKVVYCHSPARWLYQQDVYLGQHAPWTTRALLGLLGPWLRRWDRRQALTADAYIAVSRVVQQHIRDAYGIESQVIHPPHSFNTLGTQHKPSEAPDSLVDSGFDLCVSRLLPYKNVGAITGAFSRLNHRLVVVGTGPEAAHLRAAAPSNVTFLQQLSDAEMRWLYSHCTAIIAASYEDFGLTPIEAAAFGKPAVALRWGGFLDTIVEGVTGVYFDQPEPVAIATAVAEAHQRSWDNDAIRAHALSFSEETFFSKLDDVLAREAGFQRRRV
ncbi:glycosyltransferase [Agrococcus citreus]|uniref:Glycosyltransferase family 4 protein n=1 Tax=Agrococcus citreus TaxID=84643 RepID=A0ABP4JJF0_9MICO